MSLFKTFSLDANKVKSGVAVEYQPNEDGTIPRFWVAYANASNDEWAIAYERAVRPYQHQFRLKTTTPALLKQISKKVFLDAVLKGWEHVYDEDGKKLEFNRENAEYLMDKLETLYVELEDRSNSMDLFRKEVKKEDAKN